MILVEPKHEIMAIMGGDHFNTPLDLIERAGRTCYKSEDRITTDSNKDFVKMLRDRGHHAMIEHSCMMVKIVCDRGVTHEIVRHRLCAFAQESTRYCNYRGGVTFVIPPWVDIKPGTYITAREITQGLDINDEATIQWIIAMLDSESCYINMLDSGWSPQQARSVLPNSLKTEIVITANLREWMHIFMLRTDKTAHPQMREVMRPLLDEVKEIVPVVFDHITY